MSLQGWNSGYANVNSLGLEPLRPYGGSSSTLLACRVCDKIFLSTHSLIEHYESHQDEFAQRRQEHLRNNYPSSLRDPRRDGNSNNNPFQPRLAPSTTLSNRHHPYFPNGYRTPQPQVRDRNPVATSNMFLASSRTQSLLQPRNSAANNGSVSAPSLNPFSAPGRSSMADTKPFVVHQSTNVSPPQVSPTMRSDSEDSRSERIPSSMADTKPFAVHQSTNVSPPQVSPTMRSDSEDSRSERIPSSMADTKPFAVHPSDGPQPELSLRIPGQTGFDETADKVTVWYLGQLDHPIPNIIDLESDGKQEYIDLELKL